MALQRQSLSLFKKIVCFNAAVVKPTEIRCIKRWVAPTLRELKRRQEKAGSQLPPPRSRFLEWNHDAELYAFGKRLGEDFKQDILKRALTHSSYIHKREMQLTEEGSFLKLSTDDNTEYINRGSEILSAGLKNNLKSRYPEPLVKVVHDYLTTAEMLSYVASHIGLKDIVLTSEYPVENLTLANTFKAIIAALEESTSLENTEVFIKEILVPQINSKEIFDIWEPEDAYGYLKALVNDKELEPRLCNQSSVNTILANYQVGIYSDKKLLGIGWGESVEIAKSTAALNAIQRIYNVK